MDNAQAGWGTCRRFFVFVLLLLAAVASHWPAGEMAAHRCTSGGWGRVVKVMSVVYRVMYHR